MSNTVQLRDYQIKNIKTPILNFFKGIRLGAKKQCVLEIVKAPTSAGKTFSFVNGIFPEMVLNKLGKGVVITAPTNVLCNDIKKGIVKVQATDPRLKNKNIGIFTKSDKYPSNATFDNNTYDYIVIIIHPLHLEEEKLGSLFKKYNKDLFSIHDEPHIGFLCPEKERAPQVFGYEIPEYEAKWYEFLEKINFAGSVGITATPGPLVSTVPGPILTEKNATLPCYHLLHSYSNTDDYYTNQAILRDIDKRYIGDLYENMLPEIVGDLVWAYLNNCNMHKNYGFPLMKPVLLLQCASGQSRVSNYKAAGLVNKLKMALIDIKKQKTISRNGIEYELDDFPINNRICTIRSENETVYNINSSYSSESEILIESLNDNEHSLMFCVSDRMLNVGVNISNAVASITFKDQSYKKEVSTLSSIQWFGRTIRFNESSVFKSLTDVISYVAEFNVNHPNENDKVLCKQWLMDNFGHRIYVPDHNPYNYSSYYNTKRIYEHAIDEFRTDVTYTVDKWDEIVQRDISNRENELLAQIPNKLLTLDEKKLKEVISILDKTVKDIVNLLKFADELIDHLTSDTISTDDEYMPLDISSISTLLERVAFRCLNANCVELLGGYKSGPDWILKTVKGDVKGDVKGFTSNNIAIGTYHSDYIYTIFKFDKQQDRFTEVYHGYVPEEYISKTSDRASLKLKDLDKLAKEGKIQKVEF